MILQGKTTCCAHRNFLKENDKKNTYQTAEVNFFSWAIGQCLRIRSSSYDYDMTPFLLKTHHDIMLLSPTTELCLFQFPECLFLIAALKIFFRNFGTWSYEGGTITRGLWELQGQLPELDLEPFLHRHHNIWIFFLHLKKTYLQ
jgi:hypothetical protein